MENSKKVIYVGCLGFPFGSATAYRKLQIATMLNDIGYDVLVINRRGIHKNDYAFRENIKVYGTSNNVKYFHSSLKSYRPNNFVVRNFFKSFGLIGEFLTVLYQKLFCNCNLMICDSTNFSEFRYYYFLSRFCKMKFVYDYVEFVDSISNRDAYQISELKLKFDINIDKYADAFIVISKYLENYLESLDKDVKKCIIPPSQNFEQLDKIQKLDSSEKYLLYCGGIHYITAIKFVINAYLKSNATDNKIKLYLVISGDDTKILGELKLYINDLFCAENIFIFSQLPYNLLMSYYKSADALLLPLRNTIQDSARFPFKICEYLASKRPIITSDVGVVNEYFMDGKDALIAVSSDVNSFVNKINFVISNSILANEIGNNGYLLGKSKFNNTVCNNNLKVLLCF